MIVNRQQLAEFFGVTTSTVTVWTQKGMPVESKEGAGRGRGKGWKLDSIKCLQWYVDQKVEKVERKHSDVDLDEATRRKRLAEAELAEINVAKQRGEVAAIDDVAQVWASEVAAARARLLSIPSKLGPVVAIEEEATECQALISAAVKEALTELSEPDAIPDEAGSVDESAPATE